MASFLENMLLGKQYIGLEFFSALNEERIAFLLVKKKRNEITVSKRDIFTNRENLSAEKENYPAVVVISNAQVLQKEVQGTDTNDKKLLHKAFPNLQAEDFYYEIWRKGTISIIAICRKSYVDEMYSFLQKDFNVVHLSLGVTSVSNLSGFEIPEIVSTNTQTIMLDTEDNIIQNEAAIIEDTNYTINGLVIPNTHLLSFSATLKLLLPGSTTGSIIEYNDRIFEGFRQKAFFSTGIKASLAVILALLLINFFLFTYYFDESNAMAEIVSINKSDVENLGKTKIRLKEKEEKLKSFTINVASRSSSILNDIIKPLPSSILLSEIVYHPLEKKIKEGEPIIAMDSIITISGNTVSNEAFTKWVETTEKMYQVKKVTISSFGKDQENNTAFSINIALKQ